MKSNSSPFYFRSTVLLLFLLTIGLGLRAQTITPELIADLEYVTEIDISPDGKQIAYVRRIPGGENDKPGTRWYELNVVPAGGGIAKTYITRPNSAYQIEWSKDGQEIHFLARRSDVDPHMQLYAIPVNGGEAYAVTSLPGSVRSYQFSRDGKQLAVLMGDEKSDEEKANAGKGKDWIVLGENYKYNRIHLVDLTSGKVEQLFPDNLHVASFSWSADGRSMVFVASEVPETDHNYMFQKIYKVDLSTRKPEVLVETAGKLGNLAVSPDGSTLAWAGAVDISDPLPQSLFTVSMKGGTAKNLTEKYEGSVVHVEWRDDENIILHAAEGCYSKLYKVNAKNGKRSLLHGPGPIFRTAKFHAPTGLLAIVGNTPSHPSELMVGSLDGGKLERRTFHNPELEKTQLGKQEVIEWKGPDGLKIEGILTYPPNFKEGTKYPLLLQIHGGPEGISFNGFNTRAVYPVQWYAANGWLVLEPNYRGSQGRGVRFSKADHKDLGGKEFDDVLAGVDKVIAMGIADGDKVATGGFSYGGYFSAWAATKHSQRFKAAMMGAGISNWISFSGTTDIIWENSLVHWNLWWYDHMELVWDRSPMAHINNCQTPTLIVQGEEDLRVPSGQAYELYNGLKLKEVPTELVIYKRQGHGINERAASIDFMNRTLNWFNQYTLK